MSRISEKEKKLRTELEQFPSHFHLENDAEYKKCLTRANMHMMINRIKDEEQLYSSRDRPWYEHELCRDQNFINFLNYKLSRPELPVVGAVVVHAKEIRAGYPKNMVALSNLAHIHLLLHDTEAAEECVQTLKKLGPWERLLADAEIAYAYRGIGPQCVLKCLELFEKVISYEDYQGLSSPEDRVPSWVDTLQVIWSYEAADAIRRTLNPSVVGNLKSGDDYPEELMKKSCNLLKRVTSSKLDNLVARGWLTLVDTYREYRTVLPRKKRDIQLDTLPWPGFSNEKCFEMAEEAVKAVSKDDYLALMMLGQAYRRKANDIRKGRLVQDDPEKAAEYLEQARVYLQRAEELSTKPAIYHHLSLVYKDEWLMEKNLQLQHHDNIRDPGNPKLCQVISYLEKAIDNSRGTCVLFKIELARARFSFFEEPITDDNKKKIMDTLLSCVQYTQRDLTTDSIQSYLFHQLAFMYEELYKDMKQCRNFLELSAEKATSGANIFKDFEKLYKMVEDEMREAPESERCIALGELNVLVKNYPYARQHYRKALLESTDTRDAEKLETLAKRFCEVKSFLEARKCLKLLLKIDPQHLQNAENRKTFMDVCLEVALQFESPEFGYQELLADLKPINKVTENANVVLILSSDSRIDNENTKRIVGVIRRDLGVGKENCVLLFEQFGELCPEMDVDKGTAVNDHDVHHDDGSDEDRTRSISKEDLEKLAKDLRAAEVGSGGDKCSGRDDDDNDDQERSEEYIQWLIESRADSLDPVTETKRIGGREVGNRQQSLSKAQPGRDEYSIVESYISEAWCVVIHLTNTILEVDTLFDLMIIKAIKLTTICGAHVVVVDDVIHREGENWRLATRRLACYPWIIYDQLMNGAEPKESRNDLFRKMLLETISYV